ncbi:MAG: hypothetical protein AB8B55_02140 [Mariniblastus sp.]
MKTDPTTGVSGAAGTPLSYEAIQAGRDTATRASNQSKTKSGISDTLETSDREADGRQLVAPERDQVTDAQPLDAPGDLLDLTG